MAGFPTPFTVDADVLTYAHEQSISNFLASGDYDNLHTGARDAVTGWLDANGTDSSLVTNPSTFKAAAVAWFLSKLFAAEKDFQKAEYYDRQFYLEMKDRRRPEISTDETGGQVARVVVLKRNGIDVKGTGARLPYRRRRPGARFGGA